MPTYLCTATEGQLSQDRKSAIAQTITRLHCEITGAPAYFAQIIFQELKPGNHFVGGAPLDHPTLFVYGTIRAGRTAETKRALLEQLAAELAKDAGLPPSAIWIYIADLDARQIIEFGQLLPGPGEEQAWAERLPPEVRAFMESKARI